MSNGSPISISTGTMIRAVLVLVGLILLWVLRDLALIVLTSIVIASFVESAVPHLGRIGFSRVFGIVVLYALVILIFIILFYLFAPLLITEIYNFSVAMSSYVPGVSFFDYFQNEAFSGAKDIVAELADDFSLKGLTDVSETFVRNLSGGIFQTLSFAFGSIFNVILIVLISFYLSIQERGIESFLRLICPIRYEDYVVDLWNRSSRKIAFWVRGQMLLGFVVAVLIYLMLSLLGVEYALILAILAGILEMIPYGTIVAMIPAVALSYASGGLSVSFLVVIAYLIVHQFEIFLFAPLIIKKIVGLSPIVIILAALIGFELASFWGVVLALPVAILIMEFLNDVEREKITARTKHE